MMCAWFDSVVLQNMLLLAENFTLRNNVDCGVLSLRHLSFS